MLRLCFLSRHDFGGYRDRFKNFLFEKYQIPLNSVPKELNVDHVFNKGRAINYYIRMILLDETANQAWGRAYEKSMTQRRKNSRNNRLLFLDYSIFLKILELPSFKKGRKKVGKYNEEEMKQLIQEKAQAARIGLEKIFGTTSMNMEIIEQFYRAEFNQIINGFWSDPLYVNPNLYDITTSVYEDEHFSYVVEDLQNTIGNLVQGSLTFSANAEMNVEQRTYECTRAQLLNAGRIIDNSIQSVCNDLLSRINEAIEIEWRINARNNAIENMIIRLYFYGYDDKDTVRYEINLGTI
ncbi:hypothetical protein AN161_02525 [Lysinibacillus sp. FJAT-14222]|nr:hypothetical protein AN161_02525 [Lysinibacillus sp. FJAT-14222]